jgi:hypothetical protein
VPIPQLSRFTYGLTGDWTTSLPPRAWTPINETVGGFRISSAGIPAAYNVRTDAMVELTLRFTEDEWEDVLALVAFGQTAQAFYWYPDSTLTDPDYDAAQVYLQSPGPGERFAPARDGQYPRMFELTITLRGVGGVLQYTPYYSID